jgi:hypothetical protein
VPVVPLAVIPLSTAVTAVLGSSTAITGSVTHTVTPPVTVPVISEAASACACLQVQSPSGFPFKFTESLKAMRPSGYP